MNCAIVGLLAGLGASLSDIDPANATTLAEFDSLSLDQQGQIVEDAIRRIHTHVSARRPDPTKAACIRKLFVPPTRDRIPSGIKLLMTDVDEVPDEERPDVDVETVVLDLINRKCPSAGSAQQL